MSLDQSSILSDLVNTLAVYAPRVAFALIVLAIGWVLGRLISVLIQNVTEKLGLAPVFRRITVGRAILLAGYTPSTFFAVLGKSAVYLFSTFSALEVLEIPLVTNGVQTLITYLPSLLGGICVLIVGLTSADWVAQGVETGMSPTLLARLLGGLVRVLFYFVVITISLAQMKIDVTILYIFAQALAWGLAVAIGIAIGITFGWRLKDRVGVWLEGILNHDDKDERASTNE